MKKNLTTYSEYLKKIDSSNVLHILYEVTNKCVLSCKYCYAKKPYANSNFNNYELIKILIKQSFKTKHKEIIFLWTGGEPLLAGINFFKNIIKLQTQYATKPYQNKIQTSGYLLDEKLISFLVDNNFKISTTIDGNKEVHNSNRPNHNNEGTLNKILKTREFIIKKQGSCGFITTITKNSIGKEAEILSFFRSLNITNFHCNPYIYFSENFVKDKTIALSNDDYSKFYINLFNAWFEQKEKKPIPNIIDYILQKLSTKTNMQPATCVFGGRCLTNFIAITSNGDAFPCSKFIGYKSMLLGNINDTSISEILSVNSSKMAQLIKERITAINKCENENCKYFYICNGGCPYYSFIKSGGKNISEKDYLCEGKKTIFSYLEEVTKIIKSTNK